MRGSEKPGEPRALKLARAQYVLNDSAPAFALDGGENAGPLIGEMKQRFPKDTVVNSIFLPIVRVALEIKKSPERALSNNQHQKNGSPPN